MKLFLCDFSSAEYIQVAAELKKWGAEILYWTGFKDKFNEVSKDKKNYPHTIFHIILDAVRGVPPAGLDDSEFPPPSSDLIREMLECESITLTMMVRMDFSPMPFFQKKHLYYKYLGYWDGIINKLKPEAIIFSEVPHAVYNFVLYSLAKKYKIPALIVASSGLFGFQTVTRDYTKNNERFLEEYGRIENQKLGIDDLRPELRDYYQGSINHQHELTPVSMKEHGLQMDRFSLILPKRRSMVKFFRSGDFLKAIAGYFNSMVNFRKHPLTLEESRPGSLTGLLFLRRIAKIKKVFIKEYAGLAVQPDFNKKYIFFPLHMQPERTTSPSGGFYVDQILAIKTLAASIPADWLIYVKEHKSQWSDYNGRSHLCRYKNYYKELANIKNVRLLSVEVPTHKLIFGAVAVATITGTVGWEALARSKPVLFFGYPWYMDCDGTFRIDGAESCRAAISKISLGAKPDPQKALNYLIAFSRISMRTNQVLRFQFYKDVTAEESVANITEALQNELTKIKN